MREGLIYCMKHSSAHSQEMFSYKNFLFCLLHTYIWCNLLALLVYATNFTLPVLIYSAYSRLHLWLWSSVPFHPNSSLEIRLLEVSFFFFLSKTSQLSSPNHCSAFFKSHPSHVFHIASLHWVNKKQNQHKETSELSSRPKHISIELSFLSCIQICSGSVVLPLTQ